MTRQLYCLIVACLLFACGKEGSEQPKTSPEAPLAAVQVGCEAELEAACQAIREKLASTQAALRIAVAGNDRPAITELQLQLGEFYEVLQAYSAGSRDIGEIQSRYRALREIMNERSSDASAPRISYREKEIDAVRAVFRDFGDLYIAPSATDERGRPQGVTLAVEPQQRPWAGYWYPRAKAEIFSGEDAPLGKFERYLHNLGSKSEIVSWEKERWQPGLHADWEGLCDALAMASVLTREPVSDLTREGVRFTPADQKALALKYYEGLEAKVYGIRYEGSADSDGEMQDIRPEAFHRMVEAFLGEKKQALVIDSDPGAEVWAKPIYQVTWKIYEDPDFKNAYRVDAFLSMLTPRTDPPAAENDPPTDYFTDTAAPKYEYRLYVDPSERRGDKLKVVAGEWLGESRDQHPDMIFVPPGPVHKKQRNKELQKFTSELEKLLIEAKMFPEETVQ